MEIRWFGQSAFLFVADGKRLVIDPFVPPPPNSGWQFNPPPMPGVEADMLLVTHEHFDHNGVSAVTGSPHTIRSSAGTFDSPIGKVVGVASEHDPVAGTQRGANVMYVFSLGGLRICHSGDFGQSAMRPEQAEAIGQVDMLFVPVGGGPTIGGPGAEALVRRLQPKWVVPMHYRLPGIAFLQPPDDFLNRFADVRRLPTSTIDTDALQVGNGPVILVPSLPAE